MCEKHDVLRENERYQTIVILLLIIACRLNEAVAPYRVACEIYYERKRKSKIAILSELSFLNNRCDR